jgi:hypothetical protein
LENSGRYWDTSIYQYLYQYCRYWKILVLPELCTSIVVPVSRPAASYYPNFLFLEFPYLPYTKKNICSCYLTWRVSEWLVFDANLAIFQLHHGDNNLIFNEMIRTSALY